MTTIENLKEALLELATKRAQCQDANGANECVCAYTALCVEERQASRKDAAPGILSGAAIASPSTELTELRRAVVDRIVREIGRRNIHIRDTRALDGWRYNVYEGDRLIRGCASVEECEFRVAQLLQMTTAETSAASQSQRAAVNVPLVIAEK